MKSLLDSIGNTPLASVTVQGKKLHAKLEYLNPGGSVKDRSAKFLIEKAEKEGLLKPGYTIVDASSGNQGIAVAMIGSLKGYEVIISVSEKISKEKLQTISAYGAKIMMCPATQFIDDKESYHNQAQELVKKLPRAYMPNQYYNVDNALAHYTLLGPEIWEQTDGKITHFIAGCGTGGTVSGVGRYLKEKNPDIKVIAVDSVNSLRATNGNPKPYKIEGIGIDFISPVLDYSVIDEIITVSDDEAISMLKELSNQYGLLVGPSSGAVTAAAMKANLPHDACAVMIFGDSGRAYLSKDFYTQAEVIPSVHKERMIQL